MASIKIKRGQVWAIDLEPQTHKQEPGKRNRPALVIQTDLLNNAGHATTIVIPGTSDTEREDCFPLRIALGRLPGQARGGLVRSDRISEFLSGIAVAIKLPILSLAAWRSMLHPASDRRGSNEAGFGYTSSGSCRLSGGHGLPSHRL